MKLAFSNIAWPADRDDEVADKFRSWGVTGIEIAPTKLWASPIDASDNEIEKHKSIWQKRSLPIVAAQALLFGKPELQIFRDPALRQKTLEYLNKIVTVSGKVGAKAQVFGSPKNRLIGEMPKAEAWPIAVDFFRAVAELAKLHHTCVVLEANPREYGADFLTSAVDSLALVKSVDHPGVGLHLDTACMFLAGDEPETLIADGAPFLQHFHVSEPNLAPVGSTEFPHERFGKAFKSIDYAGWLSIEMRQADPFDLANLERAVATVQKFYF